MSNWIVISVNDLYDSKAAALVEAADSVQLGPNQQSRTAQVILDVTAEIRRRVARCNQLDQNIQAIPGGLKNIAVDMIIARLKNALEQPLTDDEKIALKSADRLLDRISDGKDFIDPPDNPMPANFNQTDVGVQMATHPHRAATRRKLRGLI